jgi:hypothetical protein
LIIPGAGIGQYSRKRINKFPNIRSEIFFENESISGLSFRQKPESRNFSGFRKNLGPGFRRGDGFKGLGFLFLSPFEGLIFSSLRFCRRYGDYHRSGIVPKPPVKKFETFSSQVRLLNHSGLKF